ncbi:MAG TPA: HD family hydrolase [Pyrinomonadaceae bacterium]|nr:HD family hydrolase [Pyrinomonadaceae bacterium]
MLATLIEVQRLKRLDRTGWTLRGLANGTESVAAHSFGVGATAMLLADEIRARGTTVDMEKVLRMALLHDWAETRVGDMPKTAVSYFGSEARQKAEIAAFADVVKEAGAGSERYRTLYEEYEARESLEAQIVKAADVIDLLVQALALERGGARGLNEFWEVAEADNLPLEGMPREVFNELMCELIEARRTLPR